MEILAAAVFFFWLANGGAYVAGTLFLTPSLPPPPRGRARAKVSIVFAHRDEPDAARCAETMTSQEDVEVEVVAVDDRSSAGHAMRLVRPNLVKLRVDELPAGWLGKNHALWRGWQAASGEWLLFTDADVAFHPRAVAAAVAEAERRGLDHLVLLPRLLRSGWIERMFTDAFMLAFALFFRPWAARFRRWPDFVGIGAFNLVRRPLYERIGTHERLRMDVTDDMALGKLVKRAGGRQMAMDGRRWIAVRWVSGFDGVVAGLRKNAFAGMRYSVPFLLFATAAHLAVNVAPYVLLLDAEARPWAAGSIAAVFACFACGLRFDRTALSGFPAHAPASLLFLYVVWVSALDTLRSGGVTWRGTFYRLAELKKGAVL